MSNTSSVYVRAVLATLIVVGQARWAEAAKVPDSWRDDAELTCLAFVDEARGWICGDRGVILHTADGGATWLRQSSGVDCRLHSITFVDELHGWAVGGTYDPYVHRSRGVVISTDDGGETWRREAAAMMPLLRQIRMANVREGWAVGDANEVASSGVFFTRDGGKTWSGAGGRAPAGIVAADLSSSATGVVADSRGRVLRIDGRVVQESPLLELGLRSARRIVLRGDDGLLVGDGGLVFVSADGGRSWRHPQEDLSAGPGGQCDWRAAAWQGAQRWIVGRPGSVVLHTADDGATWELQTTGQTTPLNDVAFIDERRGFAVGALGVILATDDGGQTWQRRSGEPRRTALWACFADAESAPLELLAKACAEDGYRTAATLLGRRDLEPGCDDGPPAVDRAAAALAKLGVVAVEQTWQLPLRQAALQPAAEAVLEAWGDGDAGDGLRRAEAYLVRELRTWRPDVVLTHSPAPRGDAPTNHLLHQLVLRAVDAAADPQMFPEQIEMLGLQPWQARKAFGYDARQPVGTLTLATADILGYAAESIDGFCEPCRSLLFAERRKAPANVAARLYVNRVAAGAAERELFAGMSVPSGGDARRAAHHHDPENRVRMRRTAERQRNLQAVVMQRSGEVGAGLVEQIRGLTTGLDDEQAGEVVFQLAETFRLNGRWEAARETYEYLLTRHAGHADADAAVRRLVEYLTSGEADYRLQKTLADLKPTTPAAATPTEAAAAPVPATEPDVAADSVRGARPQPQTVAVEASAATLNQLAAPGQPQTASFDQIHVKTAPSAPTITYEATIPTPAALLLGKEPELIDGARPVEETNGRPGLGVETVRAGIIEPQRRAQHALAIGRYYEGRDAAAHAAPQIGFPLAAARRKLSQADEALAFYEHYARSHTEGAWQTTAADEAALVRLETSLKKPAVRALRTAEKPTLDGRLEESCWQQANSIALTSAIGDGEAWPGEARLAWDAEYLYLAVRCRRTLPREPVPPGPRQRDADLSQHDRVDICLDVDRDYATYYRLSVDCRGCAAESCWGDRTWDPKWFVAAGGDDAEWIVEAAIPWKELAAASPQTGATWAVGVQRTSPLVGFQSWSRPAAAAAIRPEGFGYLTFE